MTSKKCWTAITIGGIIGATIALCIAPVTLWKVLLGALTGFAAGYTSYEFKEVWKNIPIAWEKATEGLSAGWESTTNWLKKPHPFLYPTIGVYIILLCVTMPLLTVASEKTVEKITAWALTPTIMAIASMIIFISLLGFPSDKGEKSLKCIILVGKWSKEGIEKKKKEGYQILPMTYRNAYRLVWAGYVETWTGCVKTSKKIPPALKAFVRFLPKIACFLIRDGWILLAKFIVALVKLIHSHERVWCGVHSAIGVLIACALATMANAQIIPSILVGSIIGATWGTLAYKIIEKIPKLRTT